MENYELDENGYKKSKLSLDDLEKYPMRDLAASENIKLGIIAAQNSELKKEAQLKNLKLAQLRSHELNSWKEGLQKMINHNKENWHANKNRKEISSKKLSELRKNPEFIEKMKNSLDNSEAKKISELNNWKKMNEAAHIKVICPHCKKEGPKAIMSRWHFDNCKQKKETI